VVATGVWSCAVDQAKPRVLVAGTVEAIATVERLLGDAIEIIAADSMREALQQLREHPDLIICSVRFDDSRMFDFLQALGLRSEASGIPVVCFRTAPQPLGRRAARAVELALEALGVKSFADLPAVRERHGAEAADEALRQLVRSQLK
jgi:CheY-like chemotaxis protein